MSCMCLNVRYISKLMLATKTFQGALETSDYFTNRKKYIYINFWNKNRNMLEFYDHH